LLFALLLTPLRFFLRDPPFLLSGRRFCIFVIFLSICQLLPLKFVTGISHLFFPHNDLLFVSVLFTRLIVPFSPPSVLPPRLQFTFFLQSRSRASPPLVGGKARFQFFPLPHLSHLPPLKLFWGVLYSFPPSSPPRGGFVLNFQSPDFHSPRRPPPSPPFFFLHLVTLASVASTFCLLRTFWEHVACPFLLVVPFHSVCFQRFCLTLFPHFKFRFLAEFKLLFPTTVGVFCSA